MAELAGVGAPLGEFFRLGLKIHHVNYPPLEECASSAASAGDPYRLRPTHRNRPVVGGRLQAPRISLEEHGVVGSAEARGAGHHSVENGLEIRRRGADDFQDLGGGRLLLQRLGEITVACLQLLEEAHVLDGDDCLVREGLQQRDLLVGEGPRLASGNTDGTDSRTFPVHGHPHRAPEPAFPGGRPHLVRHTRIGFEVSRHDDGPRPDCLTRARELCEGSREYARERRRVRGNRCIGGDVYVITYPAKYCARKAAEKAPGAVYDGVEYWLGFRRRAADDAKHLSGGRLLLKGLGEVLIALPQFRKQAHVLDGDHGLVGKGLEQSDLLVREGIHLGTAKRDRAQRGALPEQRNAQQGSGALRQGVCAPFRKFLRVRLDIGDLKRPPLQHAASGDGSPYKGDREVHWNRNWAVVGGQLQALLVDPKEIRVVSPAEAGGAGHHRVQHGLQIRGRGADDPEDLGRGRLLLQRLGEVAVALLQLSEEPHVFDRDDRLVRKSLEKLDLTLRKRARRAPKHHEGA